MATTHREPILTLDWREWALIVAVLALILLVSVGTGW